MIVMCECVLSSVPFHAAAREQRVMSPRALGDFQCFRDVFNRFAERSSLSALIGWSPARSSPRAQLLALSAVLLRLVPRTPVPGGWKFLALGFPHKGLCGRRKFLAKSEIARERLFGQRKKGRVGKARNDIDRSCDKTWAIITPRHAHLAMRNSGASIRIGHLGRRDAR